MIAQSVSSSASELYVLLLHLINSSSLLNVPMCRLKIDEKWAFLFLFHSNTQRKKQ
jgi:hypothetical protein